MNQPKKPTPIDRRKSSVVAPANKLRIDMETVLVGKRVGLSSSLDARGGLTIQENLLP